MKQRLAIGRVVFRWWHCLTKKKRIMGAIVSYGVLNQLKYDLENKVLREWALKYGIVNTACVVESHRDVYLGGVRVQWKSLSKNDKDILLKVVSWMCSNS